MRLVLAILIGATQVVGPWLCRCPAAPTAGPVADAAPPASEAPEPCCPLCRPAPLSTDTAVACHPQPAPAPADRLPTRCPCGGCVLEPVPAARIEAAEDSAVAAPADLPADGFAVPFPRVHATLSLPAETTAAGPCLPAADRLFVHHVLRC